MRPRRCAAGLHAKIWEHHLLYAKAFIPAKLVQLVCAGLLRPKQRGRSLSLGFSRCPGLGWQVKPVLKYAECLGMSVCLPGSRDARCPGVSAPSSRVSFLSS